MKPHEAPRERVGGSDRDQAQHSSFKDVSMLEPHAGESVRTQRFAREPSERFVRITMPEGHVSCTIMPVCERFA
jgi:hypothetical protein